MPRLRWLLPAVNRRRSDGHCDEDLAWSSIFVLKGAKPGKFVEQELGSDRMTPASEYTPEAAPK